MKNRLVATAGHVDHGKTALLNALTGQETDRLDEEQERGLTIDLGFAHLQDEDLQVGFIDVPGHQNFIKNMVSGIGSVQGVLFVVSAVDGWEAQSREHFEIVNLLEPEYCCFAMTKIDRADDEMQLLVRAEIEDAVASTPYENANIMPVSSKTGEGIEDLKTVLTDELRALNEPEDHGKPYCPVDRVFSVKGQGTVVTGSLSHGRLDTEDRIYALPGEQAGRVRGIQQYHDSVSSAYPGSRVALNVPDWDATEVKRGRILSVPSAGTETSAVDGWLETPRHLAVDITHDQELLAYLGTGRNKARILIEEQHSPPENIETLARVHWLDESVFARPGDRIILRDSSDRHLLGCLTVLCADPDQSLTDPEYRNRLRKRHPVRPDTLLSSRLEEQGATNLDKLAEGTPFAPGEFEETLETQESFRLIDKGWAVDKGWWIQRAEAVRERIDRYHDDHPLKPGIPVETIRSMVPDEQLLDPLLASDPLDSIVRDGEFLRREDFVPEPSSDQQENVRTLRDELQSDRLETPDRSTLDEDYSPEIIDYLVRTGDLVALSEDRIIDRAVFEELREAVREYLQEHERARLSDLRDHLDSSRKYVIPLMEYLDRDGLTVRDGDYRYLRDDS
jgi:selenocysteine-specific elongation factor